jgi:hypothetical protein
MLTWIAAPWWDTGKRSSASVNLVLGGCGAALCLIALILTFYSWHQMGASWRLGVSASTQMKRRRWSDR